MAEYILSAFADEAAADLAGQMDACERNGMRHIEMRGVNGKSIADHTPQECREIRQRLDERGFALSALGSPYGKIGIREDFAPHLEKFKRGLELCHILGTSRIRMFSFYIPEGDDPAAHRSQVMERLGIMAQEARKEGLICCHENEKGIYGDTAARCEDIARTLGGDMPLVFDPANFVQCGQDVRKAYDLLAPYVLYLHIKDALRGDGQVVPAGEGDGDLPYLLSRFLQKPGGHILTLEPHLMAFPGFDELEREKADKKQGGRRETDEAFDRACQALTRLLQGHTPAHE